MYAIKVEMCYFGSAGCLIISMSGSHLLQVDVRRSWGGVQFTGSV